MTDKKENSELVPDVTAEVSEASDIGVTTVSSEVAEAALEEVKKAEAAATESATEATQEATKEATKEPAKEPAKKTEHKAASKSSGKSKKASGKKKKGGVGKKVLIAVVVVLVVLVGGGGAAYAAFHSNPKFCNFVCHVPMDPYVVSYQDGTSVNVAQADSDATLSVTTHKEEGYNCLDCHEPSMSEQVTEGLRWVTGDYQVSNGEIVETNAKGVTENVMLLTAGRSTPGEGDKDGVEFCLRPECHEGISSLEELKAATSDLAKNPHQSHNGDMDCSTCHQTHEQSVMWCTQCHSDAVVPDGWLTYSEQQKQIKDAAAAE
jgi:hypothetical protein